MITAAIQEIKEAVGAGFGSFFILFIVLRKVSASFGTDVQYLTELFLILMYLIALLGVFAGLRNFKARVYQSGLPLTRTRLSNVLYICVLGAASWAFLVTIGSLIFVEQLKPFREQDRLALLVTSCTMFLYAMRLIQERIEWIIDLRAEQGFDFAAGADGEKSDLASRPAWYRRATR
jgi:hypothetical protein